MAHTILIIGATGVFGSRLAAHLARTEGFELLLASRSLARAMDLVRRLSHRSETKAALVPVALDAGRNGNLAPVLAETRPNVVVDCSGPFQALDYSTPMAAFAAGAHFVDLADARHYLLGFEAALDHQFRSSGLVALAGASSSPALAAAAVSSLTLGWRRVDRIDVAIAPGGQSEIGEAAVAAALSYCGRPVPIIANGAIDSAIGWGEQRRLTIEELGQRVVAPVETADAELLARRYPSASNIRFWAGLESTLEQRGLGLFARLRQRGLIERTERLAAILAKCRRLTRLTTSSTGGMLVCVAGLDANGVWTEADWRLIARNNDGPHVPPSPAAAAVRAILDGAMVPGARPALDFPLAAIEAEFRPYAIETHRVVQRAANGFVREAVGAEAFEALPAAIRSFHQLDAPVVWSGRADIDGATGWFARQVARTIGLPATGRDVPVSVACERQACCTSRPPAETWTRTFAGKRFVSKLVIEGDNSVTERFGPLTFRIGLAASNGRLHFPVTAWRLGPLPLPAMLAPRSDAHEWQDEQGRFNFDVRLSLPLLGTLAHYRGWLTPQPSNEVSQQAEQCFPDR